MNAEPEFTADDDAFHRHLAGDDWWFTETAWFSWHHVEANLGGWFYTMARHNIGTVAGGAWVWDAGAHLPWEVPYSTNYSALQLPADTDLRNCTLQTGVAMAVEKPTRSYRLGYDDPGRFSADLRFESDMAPRALVAPGSTFGHAAHFDQLGRVTGTIELHGQQLTIDCWSMRDRTWGRRPENRPRQAAYITGAGTTGDGFLAVTNTRDGLDPLSYGFVRRDGVTTALVEGRREVQRHPEHGWVESIRIDATDANGAPFSANGRSMNRIIINRHTFIDVNSLIAWDVEGGQGHDAGADWVGEDQDMWPVPRWSAANRSKDWSIPQ